MQISDLINPARVIPNLEVSGKKQLLEKISVIVAGEIAVDARVVFDLLLEREKLGSTGVGSGIAIPHGKLSKINQLYGFFVRLKKAVDYDALDEIPVDIVFVLIAPDKAGGDHLQGLALVARKLRDQDICARLRKGKDATAICAILNA